jgi:hypothetical protein
MWGLSRRVVLLAAGLALLIASALAQAATKQQPAPLPSQPKVLILGTSVDGGSTSWEAQEAAADGFAVKVVDGPQWDAMTTKQFKRYRAIIIGDNHDSGNKFDVKPAVANLRTWGAAINGNVILAGSDPEYHASGSSNALGAQTYIRKGIAFAARIPGHTGFYFAGTYYGGNTPRRVRVLDALKPNGFYWQNENSDTIHIDPNTKPKVRGLSDSTMSGWGETAHRAFTKWPKKTFHVWAVGVNSAGNWKTSDHVRGWVHFLVRGG